MRRHLTRGLLVVALLLIAGAGPASAAEPVQADDNVQQARQRFMEGLGFSDQGRWGEAITQFRAALALHTAPSIRFNLAFALAKSEDYTEVHHHLLAVIANPDTSPALRERAQQLKTTLDHELGRITIQSVWSLQDVEVRIDDTRLDWPMYTTSYVTPGTHVLSFHREETPYSRHEIHVEPGATHYFSLSGMPGDDDVELRESLIAPSFSDAERPKRVISDWRLWLGVGVATALGVTVGALVARRDKSQREPFEGDFTPGVLRW